MCARALLPCLPVYLPVSQSTCLCARFCKKASKKNRRRREAKKCCQSVLAEQGADGSRREDAWRAGAMHYSGIIQTERDHWGKTPQGSRQHTPTHTQVNTTHTCQNWGLYSAAGATSANPKSRLWHLRFRPQCI